MAKIIDLPLTSISDSTSYVPVYKDGVTYRIALTSIGGGGGVTDHGALTGLGDDDHTQYHNDARGDARYSLLGHTHSIYQLTLVSGTNIKSINGTTLLGSGDLTVPGWQAYRNRVINGACEVQQYGPQTISGTTTVYAGVDRMAASISTTTGSITVAANTMTVSGVTKPTIRHTVATAITDITSGNYQMGVLYRPEGYLSYDLIPNGFTLSFIFNTNVTGTYSVSIRQAASTHSYVTTFAATANTPVSVSVVVPATALFAPTRDSSRAFQITVGATNTGTFQAPSTASWISGNYLTASGTTNWVSTIGNFIELTELQIEKGSTATSFEYRPFPIELILCQRYFQRNPTAWGTASLNTSTSNLDQRVYNNGAGSGTVAINKTFPVTMRTAPTVSLLYDINDGAISGATAATLTTRAGFLFSPSIPAGQYIDLNDWTASAEL